jgi:Tfp pilus assembly protein PilF
MTLIVFHGVLKNGFIELDDNYYVTENPFVQAGLTPDSIQWAFTTSRSGYAHPLTWLSHILDCQVWGLNPRGHHLTSLILHIANTLLLLLFFSRATKNFWKSWFVAALFAVHPLHVESVAWVAERKDVLSTCFWMLVLLAYSSYVAKPRPARYVLVFALFAAGLMAKPMLATLPFALILLDYWPLCRGRRFAALVVEKIPLFALSMASCAITFLGQRNIGAFASLEYFPPSARAANAVVAYASYLVKTVWPVDLAVYYPLHSILPAWKVGLSGLLLALVSVWAICAWRRRPYRLVGWLWYLGILVPVIGLFQMGGQAMADRFTYISLIGVFVMMVWSVHEFPGRRVAGALILAVLMALTYVQVGYWRDSVSLFRQALAAGGKISIINYNLGVALAKQGRNVEAIVEYHEALRLLPDCVEARNNLGDALYAIGDLAGAIRQYREAIDLDPELAAPRGGLGVALAVRGHVDEALPHLRKAVALEPENIEYRRNFARALSDVGRYAEAAAQYRRALSLVGPATGSRLAAGIRKRLQFRESRMEPGSHGSAP